MRARRIPWATALVVALALLAWCIPGSADVLAYDRAAILRGEIWRLWSGHLVHFSASHLGWDLLAVALAGAWIERAGFRGGCWLWVIAPPLVSLLLLLGEPTLARYGGLSAMATACVVFACLGELRRAEANRAIWWIILALVALKIGWEFFTGETIFARFDNSTVRAIPLSHAAGAGAAVFLSLIFNRREQTIIAGQTED
jgi:rhomboid family GlyGly-CTERM serine protease